MLEIISDCLKLQFHFADRRSHSGRYGHRAAGLYGRHQRVENTDERCSRGAVRRGLRGVSRDVSEDDGRPAPSRTNRLHLHHHRNHQRGTSVAHLLDFILHGCRSDAVGDSDDYRSADCKRATSYVPHSHAIQRRCHLQHVRYTWIDHFGSCFSL